MKGISASSITKSGSFLNRNTIDMKLLREIGDALHRIEHDTYGICLECEEPISGPSAWTLYRGRAIA